MNQAIETESERLNHITEKIKGAAIEVHRSIGPGLLESAYEICTVYELLENGVKVETQKPFPVIYKGVNLDCGYRMDLVVEDSVVVEIKSIETIAPIHKAQLISYLRLSGYKVGLLINFNVIKLKDGIVRIVNNFPDPQRSLR